MFTKFSELRVPDQLLIIMALTIVIVTVACMVVYSSESIKTAARRKLAILIVRLEKIEAYLSDDDPFDAEWMKAKEWRQTRL